MDILLLLRLQIEDRRGQCYDNAVTMLDRKAGVIVLFENANPKILYTYFQKHALNLL